MISYHLILAQVNISAALSSLNIFAAPCSNGTFFGFPTWHKYLEGNNQSIVSPVDGASKQVCTPQIGELNDFWLIGLAVIEILLRIGMLAAVFFVVYAGIKYTNSRGNSDKIEGAKKTLIDAIAGLVITIIATGVVSFIGRSFT